MTWHQYSMLKNRTQSRGFIIFCDLYNVLQNWQENVNKVNKCKNILYIFLSEKIKVYGNRQLLEKERRKEKRMSKRKRVLAALLAGCMVFGMTGCMKKDGSDGKKTDKGKKEAVEVPAGLEDPYKDTVTVTTVMPENAGIQFRDGDSYDDNPWYRAYKDRFNIEVKNAWVSNDYTTKLNLSIADGNLPDIFCVTGQQLDELCQADLIWDLTDIFDKYASDDLKGYMNQEAATFKTGQYDGKLYGIPQLSYGIIDQPSQVWIRKDWKEQLDLPDPESMEDVVSIAKAFQEKFGGYGIAEDQSLTTMYTLAPGWGAHPGIWVEGEDGKLEYGTVQPQMKEVLTAYAQWYKDGIIDPDFTIKDMNKRMQGDINGDVGIDPFAQWWGYQPGPDVVKNLGKDAVFEAYKIPSANGQEVKASVSFSNYGYVVVSKDCKNPEAVMKLLNFYAYMMDHAQDKETEEFVDSLFGNAYTNIPYALRVINPMTDYNQFVQVTDALKQKDEGKEVDAAALGKNAVKYQNCLNFIKDGDPTGVGDWLQQGSPKSAYRISKEMIDNEEYVKDALWGRATETLLNAGTTLDSILLEGFTKIIVGEEPVSYFDTLVSNWKEAGGEKATEEINETYGK